MAKPLDLISQPRRSWHRIEYDPERGGSKNLLTRIRAATQPIRLKKCCFYRCWRIWSERIPVPGEKKLAAA
jgi:hypothetical protein